MTKEEKEKIRRDDFSVQRITLKDGIEFYHAYCHFAPFNFGDVQRGRHKFYQASSIDKEEAIDLLLKVVIRHLEEQIREKKDYVA